MITVLIRVKHGPEALVMTLSALVPAVAAGLVGDAVIISPGHDEGLSTIADGAGAALVVSPDLSWHQGAGAARKEWLLCLDDGDIPQEGWIRVLDRFIALGGKDRHLGRLRRKAGFGRAMSDTWQTLLGSSFLRAGDLVHKRVVLNGERVTAPIRLSARIERDPAFG
jgi:hypothetical protein